MSHTWKASEHGPWFHYNSDFSGNVRISRTWPDARRQREEQISMTIPFDALLRFVKHCAEVELERRLEGATVEEVLDLEAFHPMLCAEEGCAELREPLSRFCLDHRDDYEERT